MKLINFILRVFWLVWKNIFWKSPMWHFHEFLWFFFQESGQYLTVLIVLRRAVKILSGFGLSMNGQHVFCGDFIFSGHTMIFLLCYLVIIECKNSLFFCKILNDTCFFVKSDFTNFLHFFSDTSKKLYILHWLAWINAIIGVLFYSWLAVTTPLM